MTHPLPPGLAPEDEGRHATPEGAEEHLFGSVLKR
jgi:hypothetical protein